MHFRGEEGGETELACRELMLSFLGEGEGESNRTHQVMRLLFMEGEGETELARRVVDGVLPRRGRRDRVSMQGVDAVLPQGEGSFRWHSSCCVNIHNFSHTSAST